MSNVRTWLTVSVGDALGSGELYHRDYRMDFLPDEGDEIEILDGGVTHPVRRRYWLLDGSADLSLMNLRVDADPNKVNHRRERVWLTSRDGDLTELLLASGWQQ